MMMRISVLFTMVHVLPFRDLELKHLPTFQTYTLSLVAHHVPHEIVLLRLRTTKAADNARWEHSLDNDGVFDSASSTVENVPFF